MGLWWPGQKQSSLFICPLAHWQSTLGFEAKAPVGTPLGNLWLHNSSGDSPTLRFSAQLFLYFLPLWVVTNGPRDRERWVSTQDWVWEQHSKSCRRSVLSVPHEGPLVVILQTAGLLFHRCNLLCRQTGSAVGSQGVGYPPRVLREGGQWAWGRTRESSGDLVMLCFSFLRVLVAYFFVCISLVCWSQFMRADCYIFWNFEICQLITTIVKKLNYINLQLNIFYLRQT